MNRQEKNGHMEEARADLTDLLAKSRGDAVKNAVRDIPVEVAESLAGIRRELRWIKILLIVVAVIAVAAMAALTG